MSEALQPQIIIIVTGDAGEESHADLPIGTKFYSLQCRESQAVRLAWAAGEVENDDSESFFTLKAGGVDSPPDKIAIEGNLRRIYFACPEADNVHIEIYAWVGG